MSALVRAELLRLRTVRAPLAGAAGAFALLCLMSVLGNTPDGHGLEVAVRGLQPLVVLFAAVGAATVAGNELRRGATALTYLAAPRRRRALAARVGVLAVLGAGFAGLAAAATGALALVLAGHNGWDVHFAVPDVAGMAAGAAAGGALLSAAGALVATVTREATIASFVLATVSIAEYLVSAGDANLYMPFHLLGALVGVGHHLAAGLAVALLCGYVIVLGMAVARWALPRDLT
jgi:ABC-2 type transport system permease protein